MFRISTVIAIILFTLSVSATPVVQVREPNISLPFARRFNTNGSTIAAIDRARASQLIEKGKIMGSSSRLARRTASLDVTNTAVFYTASVGVGNPATEYTLLIDTGSSNTWIGSDKAYVKTSTSSNTGDSVSVSYGSGSFSGTEYVDTVTLSEDLVITSQSIGVASTATGFSGVDGILGIGPVDLTQGTVDNESTVSTVTDSLLSQGTISEEVIGVYFAPTTEASTTNGELSFGGVDSSKFTGNITYTPITSSSPAREYWGLDQAISTSSGATILSSTAGISDTGTTLILLATDAYDKYVSFSGATLDNNTGLLKISNSDYANLESLIFTVGGTDFEFTANAQTWPRSLNSELGGSDGDIYLVVNDLGTSSGQGLDFINGYTFLERFYSVYDTTNSQIGYATTSHTTDTSN